MELLLSSKLLTITEITIAYIIWVHLKMSLRMKKFGDMEKEAEMFQMRLAELKKMVGER